MRLFRAEYKLRRSRLAEKERLDRLLPVVVGEALELALERAGVHSHEIVCIRRIHVPVRLRLSRPDSALIAEWAVMLASAITNAASERSEESGLRPYDVVRYASRPLAILHMGIETAQARFHHVWAWQQMGLWRTSSDVPTVRSAAREFGRILACEPELAIGILSSLARKGLLRRLIGDMEVSWSEIAAAVLQKAGIRTAELRGALPPSESRDEGRPADVMPASIVDATTVAIRRAVRVAKSSQILRECRGFRLARNASTALALLAIVESEPRLLRIGPKALLAVVNALIEQFFEPAVEPRSVSTPRIQASTPVSSPPAAGINKPVARPEPTRASRGGEVRPAVEGPRADAGERAESITEFGGLLFLLHLIDPLRMPELPARSFVWLLHRIALQLQPLEANDPAALAFCGLGPAAENPSMDEEPPMIEEETIIGNLAEEIRNAVAEALPERKQEPERLMEFVCRRRARIVADPGWIEARFTIKSVATEIRRAGLDLDPDYIPWLGVVVRFVYE